MPPAPSPPSAPGTLPRKTVLLASALCLVMSLAAFLCRGAAAFAAAQSAPGIAVTSGYEEESWFALWRAVHEQPVYADETRLPYASAYFNWLYYSTYGAFVSPVAAHFGDASIPAAGRALTALWTLAGGASLLLLFRRVIGQGWMLGAGIASMVSFGPLIGWWAHTVRPDTAAFTLECAALAVLLSGHSRRPLATAVLTGLLCYAAWSFKQTYVMGLGASLLFLGVRRKWRSLLLVAGVSLLLWTATFLLQGPAYRAAFLSTAVANVYYPAVGLRNFTDMMAKTSPLWLLVATLVLSERKSPSLADTSLARDAIQLGLLGLLVALPLGFVASCKLGAGSYYHFSASVMLALVAAGFIATRVTPIWSLPAALLLAAGLQAGALAGVTGKVTLTDQSNHLAGLWTEWQSAPEPRFSSLTGFNLPWVSPASPPLVLAFNYPLLRDRRRPFEQDGLGGLIATGHFQSLLLPAGTGDDYDGGSLRSYRRGITVGDMTLFHRREYTAP